MWQVIENQRFMHPLSPFIHGQLTQCLLCGTWQDSIEGIGHGQCGACLHGMLAAYGRKDCGYAHCKEKAIAFVPRKKRACAVHFPKSGLGTATEFAEKTLKRTFRVVTIRCWVDDDGSIDHSFSAQIITQQAA